MRGWLKLSELVKSEVEVVDLALFGLPVLVCCTRRWWRLGMNGNDLLIRVECI